MNILMSACLLGVCCRYDGRGGRDLGITPVDEKHVLIPVCPEQLGGLSTPREPSEIKDGRVVTRSGADLTEAYERGARETLKLARLYGCGCALLKERSPSCGSREVYDGSFQGRRIPGMGVTARLLEEQGIRVISEEEYDALRKRDGDPWL